MGAYLYYKLVDKYQSDAANEFLELLPQNKYLIEKEYGVFITCQKDIDFVLNHPEDFHDKNHQENCVKFCQERIGTGDYKVSGIDYDNLNLTSEHLLEKLTVVFEQLNQKFDMRYFCLSCAFSGDYFTNEQVVRITNNGALISGKSKYSEDYDKLLSRLNGLNAINEKQMVTIQEQPSIFCDAFVGEHNIHFMSIYGRDTSIKQFMARMELQNEANGITTLNFDLNARNVSHSMAFSTNNIKNLTKVSTKVKNTIYGNDLSHVFIFDKATTTINRSEHRAIILHKEQHGLNQKQLWTSIKNLSLVPLLDEWRESILSICVDNDFLYTVKGYNMYMTIIKLEESFEQAVSNLLKNDQLKIQEVL